MLRLSAAFIACACWATLAYADEGSPVTEPFVVEFEYAEVRQEILVAEPSDFRVITDTPRGQLRTSGRVGRVSQGRVDLVLEYYFDFHEGGGGGETLKRNVPLGQFTSGPMSLPFSYFLRYMWVRRGVDPVPTLIESLRRRDLNATPAARHLGRLGPAASQAVPDLVDIMEGNDAVKLRAAAAAALGEIGAQANDAVPALVAQLDDARPGDLHVVAAAALWKIAKHPDAVPALVAALSDSQVRVRLKALAALQEIGVEAPTAGPALRAMLDESDRRLRVGAAAALWATTRDTQAVEALIPMFETDAAGRSGVVKALGAIGYPGAHRMTEAVAAEGCSTDPGYRWCVAEALVLIDPYASRTVPSLVQTVRENDGRGFEEASEVLARFGTTVLPALRGLLDDEDEHVRRLAFRTLGRIGTPAVDTVAEALQHRNVDVRRSAALWFFGNPDAASATPDLIRALADDDEQARIEASHALMDIGPTAVPALQQALKDKNPRTRELAERILREIEALEKMKRRDD